MDKSHRVNCCTGLRFTETDFGESVICWEKWNQKGWRGQSLRVAGSSPLGFLQLFLLHLNYKSLGLRGPGWIPGHVKKESVPETPPAGHGRLYRLAHKSSVRKKLVTVWSDLLKCWSSSHCGQIL